MRNDFKVTVTLVAICTLLPAIGMLTFGPWPVSLLTALLWVLVMAFVAWVEFF